MNLISKIQLRINGETKDEVRKKRLLANKYKDMFTKDLYKKSIAEYFFGARATMEIDYEKRLRQYEKKNYYDFKIAKIAKPEKVNMHTFYYELCDLIFPYVYDEWEDVIEGTYEDYGVIIEPGDVVIDAGANIGMFTAFCMNRQVSEIYAFEPVERTFGFLQKTIQFNKSNSSAKAYPQQYGLSNVNDTVEIVAYDENIGGSSIVLDRSEHKKLMSESIQTIRLDDFIQENNIQTIDFIKADIEGAERMLLEGAKKTLKDFKPKLAICMYHLPDDKEVLTRLIKESNPDYQIYYGTDKIYAM